MHTDMAIIETEVARSIGADVVGILWARELPGETHYAVAWDDGRQHGTHVAMTDGTRVVLQWGHYGMDRSGAVAEMFERAARAS